MKEIKHLLLSNKINTRQMNAEHSKLAKKTIWEGFTLIHTIENMEEIAKILGINLHYTEEFYLVRDHFCRLPNGETRTPRPSLQTDTAVMRVHSMNLYLNTTASTHTKNQIFNGWIGRTASFPLASLKEQQRFFAKPIDPFMYANVEGGNVWSAIDRKGNTKILMGSDQFALTLHTLLLEKQPWDILAEKVDISFQEYAKGLTQNQIKEAAIEMFASGLLFQEGKTGLVERNAQSLIIIKKFYDQPALIDPNDQTWFRDGAVDMGAIKQFKWDDSDIEKCRGEVADYLTKKAIVHRLIALDFGIRPEDLHPIVQAGYHLDTFLRPGPNQSFFITNYASCIELLEGLQKNADQLGLTILDKELLHGYLKTAKKFHTELGPLLALAAQQTQDAGFTIIPMPSSFLYESPTMYKEFPMPSEGLNINFINSICGWSSKTEKFYYIAHGMQAGDKLGNCIMDAFNTFLKWYISPLDVFFIGKDPANDFSEAMDWWNRLDTQSGIHCFTFEL